MPDGSTTAGGAFQPIAPAMSNDDERPEAKRLRQHENGITMTDSESFTPMTPLPEVKAENLFLANATASLTT